MSMRWVVIVMVFALSGIAAGQSAAPAGGGALSSFSPVAKFDPARDAAADIRAAVSEAKRTGRHVLIDVGGEWCVWCRRLDTLFTAKRELSEIRDRFYVTVKVNYSKENKNEKVLSAYPKIAGYPHFFVLDGEGKLLRSQDTGVLESGKGHDPVKVMEFLKRWAPKS